MQAVRVKTSNTCKGFDVNSFIDENKAFVMNLAHKYSRRFGADIEDLFQEGAIGMKIAYDKFDTERGVKFLTYAHYWCDQCMREYCFKNVSQVQIPKSMQLANSKLGREAIEAGQQPDSKKNHVSAMIDTYRNMVRIDDEESYVQPKYEEDFDNCNRGSYTPISAKTKDALLQLLTRDEYFILNLRLGLERPRCFSLEKIGEIIGCTREWARIKEKRAIEKLQFFFDDESEWIS